MILSGPMGSPGEAPDPPAEAGPDRREVVAAFAGVGPLRASPLLQVMEALERRRAEYHKKIPAVVEAAHEVDVLDAFPPLGEGGVSRRTVQLAWAEVHREPTLSTDGLDGFRSFLASLPPGLRGLRTVLSYPFPGGDPEPLEVRFLIGDAGRFEVQLAAPALRVLDAAEPKRARAAALMFADLAEGVYDALGCPYGGLRLDGGVLPDHLPGGGWTYHGGALVERAGRGAVEAFAQRCFKSWELADGGWFLAPAPLDAPDAALDAARGELFAACRHLPLERMGGRGWSPQ